MQLCFDLAEPLARRTDPATSHAAARQAKELAADHQRAILACLEAHGALGKDGIAARTMLTGHAVGKRMAELQRMGLVMLTGRNVPSTAGRAEREWRRL
jgi:hypothetical protein